MNYIFLGGFIPDGIKKEVLKNTKGAFQSAANNFQLSFIDGFLKNNIDIKLITAYFIGAYPKSYNKILINDKVIKHKDNPVYTSFFVNLPIIKNIFKLFSLFKNLRKNYKKEEQNFVFIYSLNLVYILSAFFLKKTYKNVSLVVIVTDLPDYPADTSWLYKYYLSQIEKPILKKIYKHIDKYIFLTEKMKNQIPVKDENFIVIEGIYSPCEIIAYPEFDYLFKSKTILYTGTLDGRYGIDQLLDVFKNIEQKNVSLVICGDGNRKKYIKELANSNNNIIFLGVIEFEKIKYLQSKATILINPRDNEGEYNKYSFPSKTMEYLASGRPVIMHKLDGIPLEYDNYINYFINMNIDEMKNQILFLINKSDNELNQIGLKGQDFILNYKNSSFQVNKILKFLKNDTSR